MAVLTRIIGPGLIGTLGVAMLVPLFYHPPGPIVPPSSPATVSPPKPARQHPADPVSAFTPTTVITRAGNGTFHVRGAVNGRAIDLVVDTGADLVAIPRDAAPGLGITVQPDDFKPMLRTASGTANGALARIDSLVIGQRELRDVDAVVVEGLDRMLLGQSALRRLGTLTINGDHMEIGG